MKMLDEARRDQSPKIGDIIKQIARQIDEGSVDLPPAPDILIKLNEAMSKDTMSIQDIVRIIMADQILTSKILKVVNSSFYSPASEITSLQQAIIFMGLKSVLSIVSVHSLSGITPGYDNEIKEILRHSLFCAFAAKKIARAQRLDPEEAFVSALLHDIGKTAILNLAGKQQIADEVRKDLLKEYHPQIGYLLGTKWHFSEVIKHAIQFHHKPAEAPDHKKRSKQSTLPT